MIVAIGAIVVKDGSVDETSGIGQQHVSCSHKEAGCY